MYESAFDQLSQQFASHADSANARGMQKYMKDQFAFFGIKAPLRKSLNSPIYKEHKFLPNSDFRKLISLLWQQEQREYQYTAMDWMERIVSKMEPDWIDFMAELVVKKSWWDTVDWLASNGIGRLLLKYPEQREKNCNKWITSDNMWLNRTAILHQLKHREQTDWGLLQAYIIEHKHSKEFFINKASGWALRQYFKYNPNAVVEFVEAHPDLSNLTKREALKHHH